MDIGRSGLLDRSAGLCLPADDASRRYAPVLPHSDAGLLWWYDEHAHGLLHGATIESEYDTGFAVSLRAWTGYGGFVASCS
jgi:hypothetical protein